MQLHTQQGFLENRYYEFKGLNLTLETLDGLLKHNGPIKNIRKYKNILGFNYFRNKINYSIVAVNIGSSAQILHTVPVTSLEDSASAVPNFIVTFGGFVVTVYGFVSA